MGDEAVGGFCGCWMGEGRVWGGGDVDIGKGACGGHWSAGSVSGR